MKYAPTIAGILLGLLFIMSGAVVLLKLAPIPPMPEGTPPFHFMAAFVPTGYLTFVKALEVIGGLLLLIPQTRNLGLLVLGPIIVNILAFHTLVAPWTDVPSALPVVFICLLAAYLLWVERRAFGNLVTRNS